MVINITESMLVFKDAVRHIWNTYFIKDSSAMSPEIQEEFSRIEQALFYSIVLFPLGVTDKEIVYRRKPLSCIKVKPLDVLKEYSIQFGCKDKNGNTVWELPVCIKNDNKFYFDLFDFFDWDSYGYIDLHYVRGRTPNVDNELPKLVLIEQNYCEFLFDASSVQ